MLLDRSNNSVMFRYVCSLDNMRIHMNLLRDSNKAIQIEAFHVFKLFVANRRKPPEIVNVLIANRSKLIRFLVILVYQKGLRKGGSRTKHLHCVCTRRSGGRIRTICGEVAFVATRVLL